MSSERSHIAAEAGKCHIIREPSTFFGKTFLKLNNRCRSIGRGSNDIRIHILHIVRILREALTKGNQTCTKGCNIVVSGKPTYQSTRIWQRIRQLNYRFASRCRIRNRLHIDACNCVRVGFHRSTERHQLLPERIHAVLSSKETNDTTTVWNRICQFDQSFSRCSRFHDHIRIQTLYSLREQHHCFTKRHKLLAKSVHIIFTSKESYHASGIRNCGRHFSHSLSCGSSIRYGVSIQSSYGICKPHHRFAKWNKLGAESTHIIFACKESDNPSRIRKSCRHLRKRPSGGGRICY